MRKSFLLVALFLMTHMFCFIIIEELIRKMEKNFFMFLPKENIFFSFPKVSWVLSALQNDE